MNAKAQWLQVLNEIARGDATGILHVEGRRENRESLLLNASSDVLELHTRDRDNSQLLAPYDRGDLDEAALHELVVKARLVGALSWEISKIRFYPKKEGTRGIPLLPPHPVGITLHTDGCKFLMAYASIVKLYFAIRFYGGLSVRGAHKTAWILFTESGAVVAKSTHDGEPEFIGEEEESLHALQQIMQPECKQISCRDRTSFPPLTEVTRTHTKPLE